MAVGDSQLDGEARETIRAGTDPGPEITDRLGAALARRAEKEGLVEVAYAEIDSPIGTLLAATTERGLIRVGWESSDHEDILEGLARAVGPRVLEAPSRLDPLKRELDEYFDGDRRRFEVPLDWSLTSGFVRDVLTETARIPFGETRTYAEVAAAAGSPRAFRAAGSALGANPIPVVVPCHRVLRKGGALGGYGGGLPVKRKLLEVEGVAA
ncbi:MAG TPA: methylated-DNA--[protein]-cysteine S-methyltransferase [Solirubrobacterales bacterium]|nr:methylated-DNA--[protein]-cysteine S-methyltransferase [Solirubrobacterales bacterium]